MELNTIQNKSNWGKATESINTNFAHVGSEIDKLKYAAYNSKLYPSLEVLQQEKPNPSVGDWAIVGDTIPGAIYRCSTEGVWSATGETGGGYGMNVTETNVTENNHYGDIINNPDDEDLTEETNENEEKVMKLADKEYNAAGFSGLGRVYIRRNISASKNILTQDMMGKANTRYIIQYDYDLNGGTLNIPENCELEFQGGLLNNGVLSFSKPCNINADRQIFNGVTLQADSVFCDTDINPAWFGVKGDGITDDTEAIKYMLSFCKNIRNKIHEMRNGADYSPRIVFKKRAYYKITSPIYINFKCHILGDPVFLYTGESIAEDINNFSTTGAAIIITNQYNTKFEFSVVRMDTSYVESTEVTTDLSDNIQFAAVKTGTCVWCNFKIHQIFGFNTGVYMRCKGFDCTWQCIFDVHYISFTLHAFIVNTIEEGWSNGNKICNTIFLGQSGTAGGIIVPSDFNHGNFLKFIGDGTYAANSWVIDNVQIETKILNKYPIYFMEIELDSVDSSKPFRDFSIKNLRLENIGSTISSGTLWKSNAPHQNINIETNLYTSVATMEMDYYGVTVSLNNPVVKSTGIIYSNNTIYGLAFDYKAMASMLYYCGRYYNIDSKIRLVSRQTDVSNTDSISLFACPSYIINIAPGQIFRFTKQQTQRAFFMFYDSSGTKIDVPSDIKYGSSLYVFSSSGYKNHLSTANDTDGSAWFVNQSTSVTYRFSILYLDDYTIESNKPIVTNTVTKLRMRGGNADRPSLTSASDGFEYYNTDSKKKEILIGGAWTSISGSVSSSAGHSFDFDYAKRCLRYLGMYYNIDDKFVLVGINNSIPKYTSILNHFTTIGEKIKLSPSQKISFSKKASGRMYIVFYDSNMIRIDYPSSDISYDTTNLYEITSGSYKAYIQARTDETTSGFVQNDSENEYYVSFILTDDYTLISNKTIEVATNENKLLFSGNNDGRPSLGSNNNGYQYYNTDLGKPIWWNGSKWIDATGTEV
ncbi:glycosyl hydrolase family 28-related protein [Bacteroides sp. ET489]|uniref:glycosyl hydrolase family 28-related protein n=1 Tax=Bacteroides sp. ET489 TaxID=3057126 RepID=UPI002671FE5F|nr:glycosyl hydrolase family 28-related protein [Bacteroides sp. ET489]MDO3391558.1 glycosyl hydrolase family 28-related protein [Bacteroides sp. ET489]